jgi:hypothetical protein
MTTLTHRLRTIGALIAAAAILGAFGIVRPPVHSALKAWHAVPAVEALPLVKSSSVHRTPQQLDLPIIPGSVPSLSVARSFGGAPISAGESRAWPVAARGYDSTAPPVS